MPDAKRALKEFKQSLRSLSEAARLLGPAGLDQAREIDLALAQSDEQWETAIQIKLAEERDQKRYEIGQSLELPEPRTRNKTTRTVTISAALRACADLVV